MSTTFAEIGRQYAADLARALKDDSLSASTLSESAIRYTKTYATLRSIARALSNDWNVDGRPLTDIEKDQITESAGRSLGLPDPQTFGRAVKGASNDSYMQVVQEIAQIITTKGR